MHPACVSAICTFRLALADDLAFSAAHSIDQRRGVGREARSARLGRRRRARRRRGELRVANLIGLGPFDLEHPDAVGRSNRNGCVRARAPRVGAECLVFTTGPAGPLPWDEAADALDRARAGARNAGRGRPVRVEHTNSLRVDVGFVHSLRDTIDLARRLGTGVCMEINACWAERELAERSPTASTVSGSCR